MKKSSMPNVKPYFILELVQISGKAIEEAFDGLIKGGTEVTK